MTHVRNIKRVFKQRKLFLNQSKTCKMLIEQNGRPDDINIFWFNIKNFNWMSPSCTPVNQAQVKYWYYLFQFMLIEEIKQEFSKIYDYRSSINLIFCAWLLSYVCVFCCRSSLCLHIHGPIFAFMHKLLFGYFAICLYMCMYVGVG